MQVEEVWSDYSASLKAFLHSRVSDPDEVDDLLQEILIRSHEKLDTLESEESLRPWLFQVANNAVIDYYRRKGREPNLSSEDLWYSPDEPGFERDLAQCVEPFIHALPQESAALLRAVDIEGRSQKELATELDISYSTLKSRVQKAREQLLKTFTDCCSFSVDNQGNVMGYDRKSNNCGDC